MKRIIFYLTLILATVWYCPAGAQISENFDSQTVGNPPSGWTSYTTETDDPGFVVADDNGIARSAPNFLAHKGVDLQQVSTSWIVSPAYTIGSTQELIFYWREKWSYAYDYSGVYISTASNDPINNPNDFVELAEFNPNDYPDTWNQWNKAMFDLRPYANQTVYIAFKYRGDFAHDFYVDDFQISDIPYCNPTPNISVDAYTDTTLDVSWDAVQGVDTYEIVWGPQGFDPNSATPTQVTGNSYTITGLTPATWYDIYVRSACSSYNYSSWSGPEPGRTSGPPPVNDTCAGAINLTVYPVGGSAGNETQGDTWDATPSQYSQTSCDSYGTNLDLFYTFTAPNDGNVVILTGGQQGGYIEAAIYDSCGGNEIACYPQGNRKVATGLTPGQTYVLQVWHDDYYKGQFTIALEQLPPPPPNNDCANAINLTVYPAGGGAGNETDGDTTDATASSMSQTSCDSYGTNLDLFYTFTAPASGSVKIITGGQQGNRIEAAIYDSCGGNEIECYGQGTTKIATGLTGGQTYVLQVWHDDYYAGPFNIVIEEGPTGPSNDTCDTAINLPVDPNGNCTPVIVDNTAASDSGAGDPGCANYQGGDVWLVATVPASGSFVVSTTSVSGSDVHDTGMAVYSGDCNNLNLIECNDDGGSGFFSQVTLTGLTPGDQIYVRVWEYGNNSFGQIGVCAYEVNTTPPANDACSGAIAIPPSTSCNPVTANNQFASDSGVPDPGCANYQGGDLWFTATVAPSGSLTIETTSVAGSGVSDTGMAVYSGDCNNLSLIECNDDGGSGLFSQVQLNGRTPGETVYIRVWEYGNNSYGQIGVCAYDASFGVEDLEQYGFRFYPNPTQGYINLSAEKNIDKVQISNIAGQVVLTEHPGQTQGRLDIGRLPAGVYMMTVYIGNQQGTYRIVKE